MADLDNLLPTSVLDKPVATKAPRCVLVLSQQVEVGPSLYSPPSAENKNDDEGIIERGRSDRGMAAEGGSSGGSEPLSVWRASLASSIARLWKHIDTMSAAGDE